MAGVLSLSVAGSLYAAPLTLFHGSASNKSSAAKMISFNVRNDSSTPLMLQAGDQQITIEPGKVAKLKLTEGASVTTVNATPNRAAGSVLATVGKQLEGNTLAVS